MKFNSPFVAVLLLACASAGAQVASHAPTLIKPAPSSQAVTLPNTPVARVNGSVLTQADLVREEYSIFPYARQHNGLPKELAPQIRAGAMKMIIFEELVYQEALRRKMEVPHVQMQKAEAAFRKQFETPEAFNDLLKSEFQGSMSLLRGKIRRSLLIESLLKIEIDNKSSISQAVARAYYDKNPSRFQHPESYTFQTISFLPPVNATAEQLKQERTRAESALRQAKSIRTSEEFGLLAEKSSEDDYRVMMGQHKPVPVDQLAPPVVKALSTMREGDVSDLIQVEQALTIIRLQRHTQPGETKFEEAEAGLRKELQQNKQNQLRADLDKKLRQSAHIEEL